MTLNDIMIVYESYFFCHSNSKLLYIIKLQSKSYMMKLVRVDPLNYKYYILLYLYWNIKPRDFTGFLGLKK